MMRRTPMRVVGLLTAALCAAALPVSAEDAPSPATQPATTQASEREALEADFQKMLSGAVLAGHFSVDGQDAPPKEDRYTIVRATKMRGNLWLLVARIQFGGKDATVPLPIPVNWAGDTPVISVTDLTVPGIGTYTARIVFYRDRYAGTWSGAKHGGEMWGKIEHPHE